MKVRKAVIPAAGLGTRFLPISKAVPKQLMPLVDRAAIQYVIEEAAEAGIEQVIIVTARGQETIADYFDRHLELEGLLEARGDTQRLAQVRRLSEILELIYVRQPEQLGLGHAVACARGVVGEEPFAVILPDDIIVAEKGALAQMLEVFDRYEASVIAVEEVPDSRIQSYVRHSAGARFGGGLQGSRARWKSLPRRMLPPTLASWGDTSSPPIYSKPWLT